MVLSSKWEGLPGVLIEALACILDTLTNPQSRDVLRARAEDFGADASIERYLEVLLTCAREQTSTTTNRTDRQGRPARA
jgi:hypothetical protein